ncbi:MAG: heavy metal-binding domain-containing protein [Bacteroidota bacterium]
MKMLKLMALATFLITASSCGSGHDSTTEATTTTNVKDTVNAFVCPMRCENSGSSQAGKCPVCAMDLVQNIDFPGNNLENTEGEAATIVDSTMINTDSTVVGAEQQK